CCELGRGAYACVFLAEQAELAGRPVVLKVSDLEGDEPQTLAQLQHTHIVPIYSVHENAPTGLRAVCMPYFGGASLARVLEKLWSNTNQPTGGEQLVRALEAVSSPLVEPKPGNPAAGEGEAPAEQEPEPPSSNAQATPNASRTALQVLKEDNYIRAAAWIVLRLAEALQHAHQRGVIHRDIKPSNVLLSSDGEPMLLDFNVAQSLRGRPTKAVLGGTVAYMAPEHLRALSSRDVAKSILVDQRADIYSLGMVLYELLSGGRPFAHTGSYSPGTPALVVMAQERSQTLPSLRQKRSDVPWSLESIARKCLAPDREQRYQQADQLAEDLRRFLEDRPLKYAPELSSRERVQKWLRRHPRLTSSAAVATAATLLLVALGGLLFGVHDHLARTREELATVQAQDRQQAYEAGTVQALCLVNTTTDVADHLRQGVMVCEQTLALYGVLDSEDWQATPNWQRLHPEERQRLAEDTRELLLALAWARVHSAAKDRAVLETALALLDRAQAITGLAPCRALWEDRALYLDQLGRIPEAAAARTRAEQIAAATARDHYLLATTYARRGRYAEAVQELDQALRLNPRHYWSLVQRGICHQELGRYTLATGDFGACIGLWPEFAWGYFNRGYALEKSGHRREALHDYTAALQRDPGLLMAYWNRGMVQLELKHYAPALADLQQAAELGRADASLYTGLGVALEGLGRHPEADAAFAKAWERLPAAPDKVRGRLHWIYGFAVSARLPGRAEEAFDEVLRQDPRHPQALYGLAMLRVEQHQESEAIALFSRALEVSPSFVEARRYRAILFARSGRLRAATEDINGCLEREPEAGATFYAAACVAALAAAKATDPATATQATEQALAFLKKAFVRGYGRDKAANDPDLKGIRAHPQFQQSFNRS
ncbi:MAG: tetratricopeptide repeat protein, partial [Gemmataceae bacterium]|nr:tetratricopeptide repeat protein [Gemmataceae bacterium]